MTAALWLALRGLWGFLAKLPWWAWLVLGLLVAGLYYGHTRYEAGVSDTKAVYEANERERIRLQKKADDLAQVALDALGTRLVEEQLQREEELQAAEQRRIEDLAKLKGKAHVTPAEAARCSDVPRSYLLYRAAAAAFANGAQDSPAAAAGAASADAPSGVSLAPVDGQPATGTYLSDTDAGQASAYKACAVRIDGWLKYKADVDAYFLDVTKILKGETP